MLDAACPGEVFTSATPDQMAAAAAAVDGGAGVYGFVDGVSTTMASEPPTRNLAYVYSVPSLTKHSSVPHGSVT